MGQTKRIIAYCCEHGGVGAAERAAEERPQFASDVVIIPVECLGRVDLLHLLHAFRKGVDAAFVAGCLEKSCHHLYGNIEARKKVDQAKRILDSLGLGGDRVEMFNLASNQGLEFEQSVDIMIGRVERLGPNPLGAKK